MSNGIFLAGFKTSAQEKVGLPKEFDACSFWLGNGEAQTVSQAMRHMKLLLLHGILGIDLGSRFIFTLLSAATAQLNLGLTISFHRTNTTTTINHEDPDARRWGLRPHPVRRLGTRGPLVPWSGRQAPGREYLVQELAYLLFTLPEYSHDPSTIHSTGVPRRGPRR